VILLHRLEQRRLGLWRGAVDLVGEDDLREDRSFDEAQPSSTGIEDAKAENVLNPVRLKEIQYLIRRMPVPESVVEAILGLVRSARPGQGNAETDKHVAWGPGPRASQALTLCARARALYDGRLAPSIDDIHALAEPVLQHRMALTFAARAEGMTVRDVVAKLVKAQG
jgi:MoxR-like ATPase